MAAAAPAVGPWPAQKLPPIEEVENAGLTEEAMMAFAAAAVNTEGLVGHNIRAFNSLLNDGIPQILTDLFKVENHVMDLRDQTEQDRLRDSIKIEFNFSDVEVGRPVYATYPVGNIKPLFPNEARLSGRTYAAPLRLAAEVVLTAFYRDGRRETKQAEIPPFQVAPIPIMVGCDRCHTWNLTRQGRKGLQEDPNESGGYFLAKMGEWVVDWLENIAFNTPHVFRRMAPSERARADFISQPGGTFSNSSQIIVRLMASGAITVEINSTKFSRSRIPFYLIYRLFEMTSDASILETIVYDPADQSPVARQMVQMVNAALLVEDPTYAGLRHELDRAVLTEYMAVRLSKFVNNQTAYRSNEHAVQYLNENLLSILDKVFLPHISHKEGRVGRVRKLRFLGMLIHKTLLVDMGILEPTDRDSLTSKRMHGAGVSIAKALKTQFNTSVVLPVLRALKREVRNTAFEDLTTAAIVDAFKNPIASSDLMRTLEQAIVSGNKTIVIRRRAVANRVSTLALERKNPTNYFSALRTISTHSASQVSKQTERAERMRRVHPSYTGYVCIAKSAEGEMVGMKKELALTASVAEAGEAFNLISLLHEDPAITPLDAVWTPDILRKHLAMVFVDGVWVGCCASAHDLVARYRTLRREGAHSIEPRTSIVWNPITDDVDFLLDVGRMVRPLLIVDNNLDAYDAGCLAAHAARLAGEADPGRHRVRFVQNTRFTPADAKGLRTGRLSLEELRQRGTLEWITPNEATNCLVAPSIAALRAARHNVLLRYTHVDVEQAIFGLTALLSPFANHTQPARVTYETNQARQAGGWFCGAYPYRVDKNRFFQHYVETPLVRTLAYNWLPPSGLNTVVAYMVFQGFNQEDSAIVSAPFVQRGGFDGSFHRYEKAELEKGEEFGNPDVTATKNLKPNASYEKLVDGFIPAGTVVTKGDVLIGRYARIQAGGRRGARAAEARDSGYLYVDRSVVYHSAENAIVDAVFRPRGPNDNLFGLVKLRYHRPMGVGDKLSSRSGNKSIVARVCPPADMPFTEDGITPDLIINPACLPGDTPVALRCGVARRIDSFPRAGGETPLWGWDPEVAGLVPTLQQEMYPKGPGDVLALTFGDGRVVRATAEHRFRAVTADNATPHWVRAGELTLEHRVICGLELPLDAPGADEAEWALETADYSFDMGAGRERALAFARILGYVLADGTIGQYGDYPSSCRASLGSLLDLEAFLDDVELLTSKRPSAYDTASSTSWDKVFNVHLPAPLARALAALPGAPVGARVDQEHTWPAFLETAPRAVLREFLGGLFGGDGHSPSLHRIKKSAKNVERHGLTPVALTQSATKRTSESLRGAMDSLVTMLARVGVPGCRRNGPVERSAQLAKNTEGDLRRVQWGVSIPPTEAFAEKVGFRYCVNKACRLSAVTAYWRLISKVKEQHDYVIAQTDLNYAEAQIPLCEARAFAVEELVAAGPILNAYYSAPPISVINRRRASAEHRQKALDRLDYRYFPTPDAYLAELGCLSWFHTAEEPAKRKYVVERTSGWLPTFTLPFMGSRPGGRCEVFDIYAPPTTNFVAQGVVVKNSIPSRMVIGQMLETTLGLVCQRQGVIADGTAFRPVSPDELAEELVAAGLRHNGKTRLYSGTTGEHYDAAIFMGPTFHQRLQKFVKDDEYAVGGYGPTDALTGQPLDGRSARGGLRLGEMEGWVLQAQGAMMTVAEKSFKDSDGRTQYLCRGCGQAAILNMQHGIYRCLQCGEGADIVAVDSCRAAQVFESEVRCANVRVGLWPKPREFEVPEEHQGPPPGGQR